VARSLTSSTPWPPCKIEKRILKTFLRVRVPHSQKRKKNIFKVFRIRVSERDRAPGRSGEPPFMKEKKRILKTFLRVRDTVHHGVRPSCAHACTSVSLPIHEREKRIFLKFLEFIGVRDTVISGAPPLHPAARVSPSRAQEFPRSPGTFFSDE
jgi:hypothetical protein